MPVEPSRMAQLQRRSSRAIADEVHRRGAMLGRRPAPAARRARSGVSVAARSRNAAPAARPPRAVLGRPRARVRRRRASLARGAASPRCHARRSGSVAGSVALARAPCASCRSRGEAPPGRRPSAPEGAGTALGCRNRPALRRPRVAPRRTRFPSRAAALHTSAASPRGSAAATSSRRLASGGSASARRRSSPRRYRLAPTPATSRGRMPAPRPLGLRGSSNSASGLPPDSATIRSRIRASTGPLNTESSNGWASSAARPPIGSSGKRPTRRSAYGRRTLTRPTPSLGGVRRMPTPGPMPIQPLLVVDETHEWPFRGCFG